VRSLLRVGRERSKLSSASNQRSVLGGLPRTGTSVSCCIARRANAVRRVVPSWLYRDAGPVELFVRHDNAATTSPPVTIDLPPPGEDVVRDVEVPAGEIRGRYPIELLDERERESFAVTLYPMQMTLHDPYFSMDYCCSLYSLCASVEKAKDGRFAFSHLGPGKWLVRIRVATKSGPLLAWQKVLDVQGDVVDVGELSQRPKFMRVRIPHI